MAVASRQLLQVPFCNTIYRSLLGAPLADGSAALTDLKEIDPDYHRSLDWILRNTIDNSGLGLSFSAETHLFGGHEVVDLVPGGRDIAVNDANKEEYVGKMAEWKTSRVVERHLQELRRGFEIHARPSIMATVTPVELCLLLNGRPDVSVSELSRHCRYLGGYDPDSQPVVWFWTYVQGLQPSARSKLVHFFSGAARLPLDGLDPKLAITRGSGSIEQLPTAHTCFNQLVLPPYDSFDTLCGKFTLALEQNSDGFHMT